MPDNPSHNSAGATPSGQAPSGSAGGGNVQSQGQLSKDEAMIASVVSGLIPKYKGQATSVPMETDDGGAGGEETNNTSTGPTLSPDNPQLSATFVVDQAKIDQDSVDEAAMKKRTERRVKGMASKTVSVKHYTPYCRGIQSFLKFFLGNPEKPQDFPPPPSKEEKENQYWVEKRTECIIEQLNKLREELGTIPAAEKEFFVSRAEAEIRKNIEPPPFTPAPKKGEYNGSRPISALTKGNVERDLASAGISRMTFDWGLKPTDISRWNSAVVEVMGRKSVEWMGMSMKVSEADAVEAPAIIQRWLHGKCQEIQRDGQTDIDTYNSLKAEKLVRNQYTRWRKKIRENRCIMARKIYPKNPELVVVVANKDTHSDIEDAGQEGVLPVRVSPVWRSDDLTTILHGLDRMVIASAQHHKTKSVNDQIYGRSKAAFMRKKGIDGAPRHLPVDCYKKSWRDSLCKFDQDTVTKCAPISIDQLASKMNDLMTLTPLPGPSAAAGSSNAAAKLRILPSTTSASGEAPSEGRFMNLD